MQNMLNVNEPDYGHLFDDMELEHNSTIDTKTMIAPKVEAEIGFVLKEDLKGPHVTFLDVIMATDYVVPTRSEEHTSELQSRFDLVCRLLLEKKKTENNIVILNR